MTKILSAFTVPTGQKPTKDRVSKRGAKMLRGWQAKGLEALRGRLFRILLAPTGSGKSTLIKSLAVDEMRRDPKIRVVVAVPQMLIARSFGSDTLRVDGQTLPWEVEDANRLIGSSGNVGKLVAWIRGEGSGRTLVCTHQTLVLAHQRLMRDWDGKKSPWEHVSLYVDEAHHSAAEDDGLANRLGAVVAHWLKKKPGHLLLATATWMRANLAAIVPKSEEDQFSRFTLTMEEHLRSMRHLREVSFRFLIGKPEEALQALYSESNAKTIAWLPPVTSPYMRAIGGKRAALKTYNDAIGRRVGSDAFVTTLRHDAQHGHSTLVRVLDFVTETGRPERKAWLDATIAKGPGKTPELLWALSMGKEGFDWPELSRAVVIGERSSIPDVIQMLGRVLRDHPGKRRAEFNVVLPYEGEVEPELLKGYIKTVLASMVVEWQLRAPRLAPKRAKGDTTTPGPTLADPEKAAAVIGATVDEAMKSDGPVKDPKAAIKAALTKSGIDPTPSDVEAVQSLFSARTKAMLRDVDDIELRAAMTEDVFGCVRMVGMQFGYRTLSDLRRACGVRGKWPTREELHARMKEWEKENCRRLTKPAYDAIPGRLGGPCAGSIKYTYGCNFSSIATGQEDPNDLTGRRFGMLVALRLEPSQDGVKRWVALCECGKQSVVRHSKLKTGHTKSCGCLVGKTLVATRTKVLPLSSGRSTTIAQCAAMTGLSRNAIVGRLVRGWQPDEVLARPQPLSGGVSAKLTHEQMSEIRASNDTGRALARRLGVSEATVSVVRGGKAFRNVAA